MQEIAAQTVLFKELREEYETLSNKLKELTGDELNAIGSGNFSPMFGMMCPYEATCTETNPASCGLHYYNNPLAFYACPKLP